MALPLFFLGTAGEIEDLGGDLLLAALVVLQGEFLKKVLAVVGGRLHRHGTGGVLGRVAVQQRGIELQPQGLGQEFLQQLGGGGFENVLQIPGRAGDDVLNGVPVMALVYPFFGYQKRMIHVKGDPALAKDGIAEALRSRGYVPSGETDGVLKFRLAAPVNRAFRMWEDTITLTPVLGGWEAEGLSRDLVRVVSSIEQYFRNHGND